MTRIFALIALHLIINGAYGAQLLFHSQDESVNATIDIDMDNPLFVTDDCFLSLGMDSNLIRDRWETFDFSSMRLKTLAKALGPAYMRLMGTDGDRMIFVRDDMKSQRAIEGFPFPHTRFNMTSSDWDSINQWTADVGWRLLFGINAQTRIPSPYGNGTFWDASNALDLLDYTVERGYSENIDFEFGNEPDLWIANPDFIAVPPTQIGEEFLNFKAILQHYFFPHFQNALFVGPDTAGTGDHGFLSDFLSVAGRILNAATFHHYYGGAMIKNVSLYIDPTLLDSYTIVANGFVNNVKSSSYPSIKMWNGETSSTYAPPGNEPNIWFTGRNFIQVPPEQLANEFKQFRKLLDDFYSPHFANALLIGPDTTGPGKYLKVFLENAKGIINATTFHQYYGGGDKFAKVDRYLDPSVLDSYIGLVEQVLQNVKESGSTVPVWQGETSSTVSPPGNGIGETFVAGFMLMDKLGVSARLGLSLVVRQTYYGFWFALVDQQLQPRPNYWLALMFKRLVGREVLDVNVTMPTGVNEPAHLRMYAHCVSERSGYPKGSMVVYAMNLFNSSVSMRFSAPMSTGKIHQFVWTAPQGNLTSEKILLNDQIVNMINDKALPDFKPLIGQASDVITMPQYSLVYYVFPDVRAKKCV